MQNRLLAIRIFCLQKSAVFTARLLAWPDEWVDSPWPELRETLDAMPAHVSVENQWAQDGHHALVQADIAGFFFQQRCNDPSWCVTTLEVSSVGLSCTL